MRGRSYFCCSFMFRSAAKCCGFLYFVKSDTLQKNEKTLACEEFCGSSEDEDSELSANSSGWEEAAEKKRIKDTRFVTPTLQELSREQISTSLKASNDNSSDEESSERASTKR